MPPVEKKNGEWIDEAGDMREELRVWRKAHPKATLDEIVAQVTWRRRRLMGHLVEELVEEGQEENAEERCCPECGGILEYRGQNKRWVSHFEGETELNRDYYYCPKCKRGFFPPGQRACVDKASLEPRPD